MQTGLDRLADCSHQTRRLLSLRELIAAALLLSPLVVPARAAEPPSSGKLDLYGDALPEHAIARCGTMRLRMLSGINVLAFVEGTKVVVSAGNGEPICFWDCSTGKRIQESSERLSDPIAISRNGRFLLTTSYLTVAGVPRSYPLSLWDTREMKVVATFRPLDHWIVSAAITNDGRRFVVMTNDLRVHFFDTETAAEIQIADSELPLATLKNRKRIFDPPQQCIAISEDGAVISFPTSQGLALFRVRSQEFDIAARVNRVTLSRAQIGESLREADGQAVAMSMDGTLLAFSVAKGIQIYKLTARSSHGTIPLHGSVDVHAIRFSVDGDRIATTFQDSRKHSFLKIWSVANNREIALSHEVEDSCIGTLAFSRDGSSIATGDKRGLLGFWDANLASNVLPLAAHSSRIRDVTCVGLDDSIATAGDDGSIRFWSADSGRQRMSLTGFGAVTALARSHDGLQLYAASRNGLLVLDPHKAAVLAQYPLVDNSDRNAIMFLHALGDGKRVLMVRQGGEIAIIDAATGQPIRDEIRDHRFYSVSSIQVSPDGKVATISSRQSLMLLDLAAPDLKAIDEIRIDPRNLDITRGMSFGTHREPLMLTCDSKHHLNWHRNASSEPFIRRSVHTDQITAMVASSNGNLVATGDRSGVICVWSSKTTELLMTLRKHASFGVSSLKFSVDGTRLISCGWDGLTYVWQMPPASF